MTDWIPSEILDYFTAIIPPLPSDDRDVPVWPYSSNGEYTVADGYKCLCGLRDVDINSIWKQIWTLKTKERTRHHVWLLLHNRLLTNERKAKMHFGSATCYHCEDTVESTLHALRDCPIAKSIWLHLLKSSSRNRFFEAELDTWISLNLSNNLDTQSTLNWPALWATTTHMLWNWRNKATHDPDFTFPFKPWLCAIRETSDYASLQNIYTPTTAVIKQRRLISWVPPDTASLTLNTDGSCLVVVGLAGCGGLLRDSHGTWKCGFSKSLGRCTAYLAELWAIYEGLLLAHDKQVFQLIVETDALEIINTLHTRAAGRGEGRNVLRRINNLIKDHPWKITFRHVYKEANVCAHLLASIGSSQIEPLVIYDIPPRSLIKAVDDDRRGVGLPRDVIA